MKINSLYCSEQSLLLKTFMMVKLIICFILTSTLQVAANNLKGQEKISLRLHNSNLKTVLNAIEKQTNLKFVYLDKLVENKEIEQLNISNQPWNQVLGPILQNVGLSLQSINDNRIVLSPIKPTQEGAIIKGIITDKQGSPLTGVSVVVKENNTGGSTDIDGKFELKTTVKEPTLIISYVGYITQTIPYSSADLKVVLDEDLTALNEIVVVGFGTQKKANLTGAVSSVDMEKVLGDRPVSSASQALQGAVPGMQVTFGSGRPGQSTDLNIRGITSINGGSPLILVDNVPMSLDNVNPKDIQNVTVLKDAAAASIYGARAAFGVVLITTKKGAKNQPTQFNYSTNLTSSSATSLPEKASPLEFIQALKDFGNTTYWTGQNVDTWLGLLQEYQSNPTKYPEGITTVNGTRYALKEYDMYNEVFEKGFEQLHNLSVSGGSEKIAYRLSGMFTNEDGIMASDKDSYKKYNLNSYVSAEIARNLNISGNILYRNDARRTPMNMGEMFYRAISHGSFINTGFDIGMDGTEVPYGTPNNYLKYEEPSVLKRDDLRLFGKLEYSPIKGLNVTGEYTFNKNHDNDTYYQVRHKYMNPNNYTEEYLFNNEYYQRTNYTTQYNALNLYASYNHALENHNFKYLIGTNYEKSHNQSFWANRADLLSPSSPSLGTSTGNQSVGDGFGQYAVLGYFGRINYDYNNKYLLEINGRFDGSSRFLEGSKFGFFPSVSAGWNIAEENFMSDIKNQVNLLKLRGSFGEIGNQVVLNSSGSQVYFPVTPNMNTSNANWINPITGIRQLTIAPPSLVSSTFTWENVRTLNLGVDLGILQGRLNTSFDWFKRQTIGMLYQGADLPAVLGATPPFQNSTNLESKGWEWELTWKDNINKFNYSLGFNLSDNQGYITKLENSTGLINSYYEGKQIGEIWGYVSERLYTVEDFVEGSLNANLTGGTLKQGIAGFTGVAQNPGDIKYADLDGDGVIFSGNGTLSNPGDMKVIGNNTRRYQYGINGNFNYKNIDLSIFLQGVGKRDIWMSNHIFWPFNNEFNTVFKHNMDYWTPENTESHYGRVYANAGLNTSANKRVQTRFLQDGSYLRIRNITLGYNLPQELLRTKFIKSVRLFATGENLFTFDNLPTGFEADGADLGSGGIYPFLKKYSFGLNVNF